MRHNVGCLGRRPSGAASAAAIAFVPGAALAHVSPDRSEVPAGAYTSVNLTVPHGCEDAATEKVEVQIPEALTSASAAWIAGWDAEATPEALETPIDDGHGGEITERIALQRRVHTDTDFQLRLDPRGPLANAAADLVKGIVTNLVKNAAEAAGPKGIVRVVTSFTDAYVLIDVHDSGPGLSEAASATLFEPTITFKKQGMGLGLSIAKKNAMLSNGDLTRLTGELGGAAFRVSLRRADSASLKEWAS